MSKKKIVATFLAASMAILPATGAVAQSHNAQYSNSGGEQLLNFGMGLGLGLLLNELERDNRRDYNRRDHRRYDRGYNRGPSHTQQMARCFQAQAQLEKAQHNIMRDGRITMTERHRLERLSRNVYLACGGRR